MILIIAAMEEEYSAIEKLMKDVKAGQHHFVKYHQGKIHDQEVMLMLSGIGKVNAGAALVTILNDFTISYIINVGSAGGLVSDYDVNVFDIVIAKRVVQHDVDLTLANRLPGVLPDLPQYYESEVDSNILNELDKNGLTYHYATIASGDQFVCDLETVNKIVNNFEDVCAVEMEAGAIAQIAYLHQIPFVVFRSISDVVNKESDNQIQFEKYIEKAAENSALATSIAIKYLKAAVR